jgi:hypothetical protein
MGLVWRDSSLDDRSARPGTEIGRRGREAYGVHNIDILGCIARYTENGWRSTNRVTLKQTH